jgi:hypothetical protein
MTTKIAVSTLEITQKIPPGAPIWGKFNASFENLELDTLKILDHIYHGRAVTTWHKEHWRTSENYLLGQHIGLDFDGGTRDSSISALLDDSFVIRYGSFLYTTISHTDESPRSRVMFLLDQPIMQAKNYTLAVSALLWLFGTADRQCKDAVRFFYGSKDCKFEYLNNTLPLEVVKKLISQYQATGQDEHKRATHPAYTATADEREVADALRSIPPWSVSYDEWVSILMALHSQFGDGGYSLAASWADAKPHELEQKWKSFKTAGNTSGAVTIATVFKFAKDNGWRKSL